MGSATSKIDAYNKTQQDACVSMIITEPSAAGEPVHFVEKIPANLMGSFTVSRNQVGSVKCSCLCVYEDGHTVFFKAGIEDHDVNDQLILRPTDVLYNSRARGRVVVHSDIQEHAGQKDITDVSPLVTMKNGTPWKATITWTFMGREHDPRVFEVEAGDTLEFNLATDCHKPRENFGMVVEYSRPPHRPDDKSEPHPYMHFARLGAEWERVLFYGVVRSDGNPHRNLGARTQILLLPHHILYFEDKKGVVVRSQSHHPDHPPSYNDATASAPPLPGAPAHQYPHP